MVSAKDRAANKRLLNTYGITLQTYNDILEFQGKRCAICKRFASLFKQRLAVDHDHATGLVRGLLCSWCNRGIAKFKDSFEMLYTAAQYIKEPPAVIAIGWEHFTAPGRVGSKKRAKLLKAMQEKSGA